MVSQHVFSRGHPRECKARLITPYVQADDDLYSGYGGDGPLAVRMT